MSSDLLLPLPSITPDKWLSSGSTLLNLACSGNPNWALAKGLYFWLCGDSSSGKTWLVFQIMAEATKNSRFDDYDLIYDDVEHGALMDVGHYFGESLAKRLIAPAYEGDTPIYSTLLEEFYFNLDTRLDDVIAGNEKPFIWVLDSMDGLSTKFEGDKFDESRKAHEKDTDATGDYGDGKAKINSRWLRNRLSKIREAECILLIISQTRDKLNAKPWESKKTVSGGHALQFYATWRLWTSKGPVIKQKVGAKDREVGITARMSIKKNRLTGRDWDVELPIYHSFGIDEVGSCVDYLIDEKYWQMAGSRVAAPDITDKKYYKEELIKHIEAEGKQNDLRIAVKKCFDDIAAQCVLQREKRY